MNFDIDDEKMNNILGAMVQSTVAGLPNGLESTPQEIRQLADEGNPHAKWLVEKAKAGIHEAVDWVGGRF